jgi:hypothetical protein
MSFGRENATTRAWALLDSEKAEHAKTRAELERLRAALQLIADDGAASAASYAKHVLGI